MELVYFLSVIIIVFWKVIFHVLLGLVIVLSCDRNMSLKSFGIFSFPYLYTTFETECSKTSSAFSSSRFLNKGVACDLYLLIDKF